ncbi:MAG: hypothetical protein E7587_03850 [Ruminococcaceae bacterium]|nr:hypothetical protein [Oscillospiraceae bacterium]
MISIGKRREIFCDSFIINEEISTAKARLHNPVRRGVAFPCDEPWEGNISTYANVFFAEGKWLLYYRTARSFSGPFYICRAESEDGIVWNKPALGAIEINGSTDNNAVIDQPLARSFGAKHLNDCYVFYDENPDCPKKERYKAVMSTAGDESLISLVSADGIHFSYFGMMTDFGAFDSQNLAFYSKEHKKYFCYYRYEHKPDSTVAFEEYSFYQDTANKLWDEKAMSTRQPSPEDEAAKMMRDIRVMESEDFIHWTESQLIKTKDERVQFYTNAISPYPRAPHIFIGFPVRYYERKAWTPNYDELCGRDARLDRIINGYARGGLVITDGLFMCSRDGYSFERYDEAFLRPPAEHPYSWMYGDCYAAAGLAETPSDIPLSDPEYSLYVVENYRAATGYNLIVRYTIRLDGFVSRHADADEALLVTKEFTYDGSILYANIATSAKGHAYFTIKCGEEEYTSYEVFGNSVDKKIHFHDEEAVARLSGRPVTLEVRLMDADIYAIRFDQ